jgi:hypothetical protein
MTKYTAAFLMTCCFGASALADQEKAESSMRSLTPEQEIFLLDETISDSHP